MKTAYYHQSGPETSEPDLEKGPFEFSAFAETANDGIIAGAAVSAPDGRTEFLWSDHWWSSTSWEISEDFPNQTALDAAFPDGIYTLNISGQEEGKFSSLDLNGGGFPSPILFKNFEATQAINAEETFSLTWESSPGMGENDFIIVAIEDPTSGDEIFTAEFLPPTTETIEIPQGILQNGQSYEVWIMLVHVVDEDTTSFTDGRGIAGYATETKIRIETRDAYEIWAEQLPIGERGTMDDPGGHGIMNLLRYAFAMDPLQPSAADLPQIGTRTLDWRDGKDHLSLRYYRRWDADDLRYIVEYSSDLLEWEELHPYDTAIDPHGHRESVTIIDPAWIDDHTSRFLRVRVERPDDSY